MSKRKAPGVYVIAEMGSTWRFGREVSVGRCLIREAARAGADAVKVQWVSDPAKLAKRRRLPEDTYDHLRWPLARHHLLVDVAYQHNLEYISTVFLPEDVQALYPYVDRFKVASLDSSSDRLLAALREQDKPVIVSLGCQRQYPNGALPCKSDWLHLHCIAAYPAPLGELNLRAIKQCDGYSDHSGHMLAGALAVACGAKIIEVHCRLRGTPKDNPDYPHSLDPVQLQEYIANVRLAETMLGDGRKRIMPSERPLMKHRVRG